MHKLTPAGSCGVPGGGMGKPNGGAACGERACGRIGDEREDLTRMGIGLVFGTAIQKQEPAEAGSCLL